MPRFKDRAGTDFIVVHCAATPSTMDIGADEIDQWHRDRGWLGIGYHLVIRRDGTIEPGRPLNSQGAHVRGFNDCSIGICLVGGVDGEGEPEDNFTVPQEHALIAALNYLDFMYPGARVMGHYEFDDSKACPSFNVQEFINSIPTIP